MRNLLSILAFVITLNSFGQLPEYSSNISDLDMSQSQLYRKFKSDYEFVFSYTQNSFWNERQEYAVLAFNGTDWKLIKWSYQLDKNRRPIKQKSKSYKLNSNDVTNFLDFINSRGFFTFNQGALNLNRKDMGNGTTQVRQISDGVTDVFEVISASGHRISSAHEAVQLQEFAPTEQRENFIKCRNEFIKLVNNKSR
jgi:hypothetical protein